MCGLGLRWAPLLGGYLIRFKHHQRTDGFHEIIDKRIDIFIQGYLIHLQFFLKKNYGYIHQNFIDSYIFENRDYISSRFFDLKKKTNCDHIG
jgi:hypothetical protein